MKNEVEKPRPLGLGAATDLRSRMVEAMAAGILAAEEDGSPGWATAFIAAGKDDEHAGDCTNLPGTCIRCVTDEQIKKADAALTAALAVLDEAGYQITRREQMTGEEFEALFPRSEPNEKLRAIYAMGKAAATPDVKEG